MRLFFWVYTQCLFWLRNKKYLNSFLAHNDLYLQFGTRSGLTERRDWPGSKMFDTLVVFPKRIVWKKWADTTKAWKNTQHAKGHYALLSILSQSSNATLLSPRFFKKASGILQSPPSVCLSVTLSPPKPLDKIQPNLVCELLTWMGCATAHFFFCPAPWGPWEGPKGQILLNIIKFQLQSQFQRFFNQTLCVFPHMKDINYIRWDFHLVTWVMPQGSDLGVLWGVWGVKIFLFRNSTIFGVWVTYMNGTCTGTIFWVPAPWGLGEGPKDQISLNLNYKVNFKGF